MLQFRASTGGDGHLSSATWPCASVGEHFYSQEFVGDSLSQASAAAVFAMGRALAKGL